MFCHSRRSEVLHRYISCAYPYSDATTQSSRIVGGGFPEPLVLLHLRSSLKYISVESRRRRERGAVVPVLRGTDHAQLLEVCCSARLRRDDARRVRLRRGIHRRHGGGLLAPVHSFSPGGPRLGRIFLGARAFRCASVSCGIIGLDGTGCTPRVAPRSRRCAPPSCTSACKTSPRRRGTPTRRVSASISSMRDTAASAASGTSRHTMQARMQDDAHRPSPMSPFRPRLALEPGPPSAEIRRPTSPRHLGNPRSTR